MPSVTLNRKAVERLIGKKLKESELKERISYLGTDLESIDAENIHVEIFPNRPDMLSEQGFARALSSFLGINTGLKKYDIKPSGKKVIVDKSVAMRPYTACAIIKNVKFTDENIREIMQIQEKLAMTHGRNRKKSAYGIYPTENVHFPINYIAKDPKSITFWPLGMPRPMRADDVEELHPKGIEYKWVAKDWSLYPFFIDSKDNVMCMLPYTNSHDTGKVDENTKEIFIECTGTSFENISVALNIFVTMFADMGGEIYTVDIQYPDKTITTPDLSPKEMEFDIGYINKLLGLTLTEKNVKELLEKMGYGVTKNTALIPAYRADVLHQVDLIEDIAIAYGYENFKEVIPKVATIGHEDNLEIFKRKVTDIMVGLGLIECKTYHLTSKDNQTKMMNTDIPLIELANALNAEFNVLQSWLIPSLLEVLKNNRQYEYPQNIFSIGSIFKKGQSDTGVIEQERLSCMLCSESNDFTRIMQMFDYLMRMIGAKYTVESTTHPSFIPGRVARIIVNEKKVAYVGELSPSVLENWELEMPVVAFELNLTELFEVL